MARPLTKAGLELLSRKILSSAGYVKALAIMSRPGISDYNVQSGRPNTMSSRRALQAVTSLPDLPSAIIFLLRKYINAGDYLS